MRLEQIFDLPEEFDHLMIEALNDGHDFLQKMKAEWDSGKNRFAQDKEFLFSVRNQRQELVAIGGLNIDPYLKDPSIGRIRHLYVKSDFRNSGVGKLILERLIDLAKGRFKVLRLRTHNLKAFPFYQKFGFIIDDPNSDEMNTAFKMTV